MSIPPLAFAKPSLMEWNGNKITDHQRSALDISVERIGSTHRLANGTMRKYVVADKRTFTMSWEGVPHSSNYTVDGYWGAKQMEAFYDSPAGADAFDLTLYYGDGTSEVVTVMFTEFSSSLQKRGLYDFYDVDVTLEEV